MLVLNIFLYFLPVVIDYRKIWRL